MWQVEREEERERIARERKTERTKDHLEIYTLKFIKSVKNVCFLTTAFPRLVQDLQINPHVTNYPFMSRSISGGGSRAISGYLFFRKTAKRQRCVLGASSGSGKWWIFSL